MGRSEWNLQNRFTGSEFLKWPFISMSTFGLSDSPYCSLFSMWPSNAQLKTSIYQVAGWVDVDVSPKGAQEATNAGKLMHDANVSHHLMHGGLLTSL